jgi:endonuclease/exonuclease/phosphatase family metal-dependent hydrolase
MTIRTEFMQVFSFFVLLLISLFSASLTARPNWAFEGHRVFDSGSESEAEVKSPMVIWWNVGLNAHPRKEELIRLESSIATLIHPKVDVLVFGEFQESALSYRLVQRLHENFPYTHSVNNYFHLQESRREIKIYSRWPLGLKKVAPLKWRPIGEKEFDEMADNYSLKEATSRREITPRLQRTLTIVEVKRNDHQSFYLAPVHLNNPWAYLKNQSSEPASNWEKMVEVVSSDNNPLFHQLSDLSLRLNDFYKVHKSKPLILIGDFNMPRSPLPVGFKNSMATYVFQSLHRLTPIGKIASRGFQILRESGFKELVPNETKSFPEKISSIEFPFELQIDHALALGGEKLEVMRAGFIHQVDENGEATPIGSDHRPLVLQFAL